ncbi:DUF167 domain-containing protein [Candidatus Falkowbacteria bacterium]|uniref:UPF0235 protein COT80_02245 n=1 Tax=Candidatus Buchananbacteria bacterium CG10_big_fil_rev_8_21_14_0_10_33_19 TaxID=1974525 RepID=A0A2H0W4Y6_9BACT|nr:DUF167 domain-containing protein [Candidatus Falkowbacteria bacterium]PIS06364.1 MAG: hypothetical protein COT80_02245 [Candidatus Buchananbacteria bacterium CG10_big_fil_rev_8_21_14_0_10_33_19]
MTSKTITVEVKTNSKEIKVEKITDSVYKVKLKATPIEGKANKQLIDVLSKYLGLTKSQIEIKSGKTSKTKVLVIYG